jgi:aldehyde:ferredoxin oxidoreductase
VPYGYHGKILHIDLSSWTYEVEEPDDYYWRVYAGGGLLGTEQLMRLAPAKIDAFDPRNPLIFSSSVMAGHPYVGLASFTITSKSPLSGGVGEANCEGPFGIALKGSGADAVVFTGASESPVVVLIEAGAATFHPVPHLWGQGVQATTDWVEGEFGRDVFTAAIGQAGENRVRYASVVTHRAHQAARTGLGAVMGAKRLKAVVIRGDDRPPVADPETCQTLTELYRQRMPDNPLAAWQHDAPGFSAWVHTHGTDAALCTRNYQESTFEGAEALTPAAYMERYAGSSECPGCPSDCFKYLPPKGRDVDPARGSAMHQEIVGALGPNIGVSELDFILEANVTCNDYGLDPTSLGFVLSMVMECNARGIELPAEAASLHFGDARGAAKMIERIALRRGVGDLLAEGTRRMADLFGVDSAPAAMHVKGIELGVFEPRTQANIALGYATSPVGPRFNLCEHDWDFDPEMGWPHTLNESRSIGILKRLPMDQVAPVKVRNFKALSDLWSACNALGLCIFAGPPTRSLTLDEVSRLLGGITGWRTSSYEVMRYGDRRVNLMRAYNVREGLTAADDTLPSRFFDQGVTVGRWENHSIDEGAFREVIATYYATCGWSREGVPAYATLLDSKLEWVVDEGHIERVVV